MNLELHLAAVLETWNYSCLSKINFYFLLLWSTQEIGQPSLVWKIHNTLIVSGSFHLTVPSSLTCGLYSQSCFSEKREDTTAAIMSPRQPGWIGKEKGQRGWISLPRCSLFKIFWNLYQMSSAHISSVIFICRRS